jgi:hypothetical protein
MEKIIFISIIITGFCTLFSSVNGALNLFYPSFFSETNCSGTRSWTIWFNVGKPNSSAMGDNEDTALILSLNYRTGTWRYGWRWAQATDIVAFVSFYSTEPVGVDFQVRYCCSKETIIETITTTTTPMPLDNLTCGKQEIPPRSQLTARIFGGTSAIANSWPWVRSTEYTLHTLLHII